MIAGSRLYPDTAARMATSCVVSHSEYSWVCGVVDGAPDPVCRARCGVGAPGVGAGASIPGWEGDDPLYDGLREDEFGRLSDVFGKEQAPLWRCRRGGGGPDHPGVHPERRNICEIHEKDVESC